MALAGVMCAATISTDAYARGGRGVAAGHAGAVGGARVGVARGGVYRGAAVRRGVAVGAGAAAVGAYGAYGYPAAQCGYYPYPPCQ